MNRKPLFPITRWGFFKVSIFGTFLVFISPHLLQPYPTVSHSSCHLLYLFYTFLHKTGPETHSGQRGTALQSTDNSIRVACDQTAELLTQHSPDQGSFLQVLVPLVIWQPTSPRRSSGQKSISKLQRNTHLGRGKILL